ncbi:Uncharacterised protein [BD1-7 clade bacterium]|uniref:Poly(Hydroxyalcanoate) granule associated protein (Phasin) n=1 Tax=BD1-7 clade bacterium TaxID=2029982 RepID=A0A5S9R1Z3_9GAMM|nr:Uncharacterised protein [BD1-7 clade bacterium]
MSAEKKAKEAMDLKEMAEKASDLAKNIWLAGLGAYGKAYDEAQDQYDKVTGKVKEAEQKAEKETANLFEELIAKGKVLEEETQSKLSDAKDKASTSLEDRLSQVKDNLAFTSKSSELDGQLEEIASKLDLILDAVSASKAPAKKAPAKKAAAATATRTASTAKA